MVARTHPGQRLSNRSAVALLTRVYPREVVEAAVEAAGRGEQRRRLLPAWFVVYYVMTMALFRTASYDEVFAILADGLAWQKQWEHTRTLPTRAAIFKARRRLGTEPLRMLYQGSVGPLGEPGTAARWLGRQLVSVDQARVEVPSTVDNASVFGRHRMAREGRAAPGLRLVGLVEAGSDTIMYAALGAADPRDEDAAETGPVAEVLRRLEPGMLCLASRAISSVGLWREAAATGADLLWPIDAGLVAVVGEPLADGSRPGRLVDPSGGRVHARGEPVRVIGPHRGGPEREGALLVTTITDPEAAPAERLAAATTSVPSMQTALRGLGPDPDRADVTLRSKRPDGVYQEAYGLLLVHFALRWLLHGRSSTPGDWIRDPEMREAK